MRRCPKCLRVKTLFSFPKDRSRISGRYPWCSNCNTKNASAWGKRFPAKRSVQQKLYRNRHPERRKAICAHWFKTNKPKARSYCAARRARCKVGKKLRQAIEKIYTRAHELQQWFDVVVDHTIPLAKGGRHHPANLQIIYRIENLQKGARLDYAPSVVFV